MPLTPAPPPDYLVEREQLTNRVTDRMTQAFRQWLLSLTTLIQSSARVLATIRLTLQSASIGSTVITLPTLAAGTYRLTYYARITTAASVSSSLTVGFGWTESTAAQAVTATPITGNTVTTVDSGSFTMDVDQATSLTYSTTWAPVGTPGAYRLTVIAEQLA